MINLSSKLNDTTVRLVVSDNGAGIPEKDLPHIFQRFFRVEKGRSRELGGTGLGLSIVKHIVAQHGGQVIAHSKTGEGTRIEVILPFDRADSSTAV
jgi:signal transduction histidine kinase